MTTIADLVEFAQEEDLPLETPLRVYVAVADALNTEAHGNEMEDDGGALWSTYPMVDQDGLQLMLQDIQPRKRQE